MSGRNRIERSFGRINFRLDNLLLADQPPNNGLQPTLPRRG